MDAADLLTGDRLLNDDGSWAEVVLSEVLAEPLRAYNLTVEGWHTYFVTANADAAPVWVHNDCLPDNWVPRSISNPNNWNGCERCARDIKAQLHGGDIVRIRPQDGAPSLGGYRGNNPGWAYHEVVVKDGRVYDAFGPRGSVSIDEYKSLFQYPDAINFGF